MIRNRFTLFFFISMVTTCVSSLPISVYAEEISFVKNELDTEDLLKQLIGLSEKSSPEASKKIKELLLQARQKLNDDKIINFMQEWDLKSGLNQNLNRWKNAILLTEFLCAAFGVGIAIEAFRGAAREQLAPYIGTDAFILLVAEAIARWKIYKKNKHINSLKNSVTSKISSLPAPEVIKNPISQPIQTDTRAFH